MQIQTNPMSAVADAAVLTTEAPSSQPLDTGEENYRLSEDDQIRITEDGQTRIAEN